MQSMKLQITFLCIMASAILKSQNYSNSDFNNLPYSDQKEVEIILAKKDSLKLIDIYEKWHLLSLPISAKLLEEEKKEIQELYNLFPVAVGAIVDYYEVKKVSNKDIYIYVKNSILIEIGKNNFPFMDLAHHYLAEKSKEEGKDPWKTQLFMPTNKFIDESVVHPMVIKNFHPSTNNIRYKFVYDNAGYEQTFNTYVNEEYLSNTLSKRSKNNKLIEYKGTYLNKEFVERKNFYTGLRINICDRINKIVFAKNLDAAFIVINTGTDYHCCPTLTLFFEKENDHWNYIAQIDNSSESCTHITCEIK